MLFYTDLICGISIELLAYWEQEEQSHKTLTQCQASRHSSIAAADTKNGRKKATEENINVTSSPQAILFSGGILDSCLRDPLRIQFLEHKSTVPPLSPWLCSSFCWECLLAGWYYHQLGHTCPPLNACAFLFEKLP